MVGRRGGRLMVACPIMWGGGGFMARREDFGRSWLLAVSIPALFLSVGFIIKNMVPSFRGMQERIDEVNRLLREQITGVRVVRAFVREPAEARRFGHVNGELTNTALVAGRLQAFMFPIVILVLHCSSVAVLWVGSGRVSQGQMQAGPPLAFLSTSARRPLPGV